MGGIVKRLLRLSGRIVSCSSLLPPFALSGEPSSSVIVFNGMLIALLLHSLLFVEEFPTTSTWSHAKLLKIFFSDWMSESKSGSVEGVFRRRLWMNLDLILAITANVPQDCEGFILSSLK